MTVAAFHDFGISPQRIGKLKMWVSGAARTLQPTLRYPEYRVTQFNIIVDVLGGYSRDVRKALKRTSGR